MFVSGKFEVRVFSGMWSMLTLGEGPPATIPTTPDYADMCVKQQKFLVQKYRVTQKYPEMDSMTWIKFSDQITPLAFSCSVGQKMVPLALLTNLAT